MWPENQQAVQLFGRMGTRWAYAPGGMGAPVVTGLRWEAIYPLMDRLGLSPDEWEELHDALEVMERAALPVIRSRK